MNNRYAIIMAGGVGSRLADICDAKKPKQFHDLLGTGKSLLQMTVDRAKLICPISNIIIVTEEDYVDLVESQLPEIPHSHILIEPRRAGTAPCIALATRYIESIDETAVMVIMPSDHLITDEDNFKAAIDIATQTASIGRLVTLGCIPTYPSTEYGYIKIQESNSKVSSVTEFIEKPEKEVARKLINLGNCYWNSGIFIWTVNDIIKSFELHLPEIVIHILGDEISYEELPISTSIDVGILQKAKNISMIKVDIGWSDLGTKDSLIKVIGLDAYIELCMKNNR